MINEKDTSKEKTLDGTNVRIVADCIYNVRQVIYKIGIQKSDNIKADVEKAISELEKVVDIDENGFVTEAIRMLEIFLIDCASKALDISDEFDKLFDRLVCQFLDYMKSTWGEADEKS